MSHATFRQGDITRAVRAAKAAGIQVARVEIQADKIVVISTAETAQPVSDFDTWKASHADKA